jgi:hypothetical protein
MRSLIKENMAMASKLVNLMPENAQELQVYKCLVTASSRLKN